MNAILFACLFACVAQNAYAQFGLGNPLGCNGLGLGPINPLAGPFPGNLGAPGLGLGGLPVAAGPIAYGDVAIAGELPVGGNTAIAGNVPVVGYVMFEGNVPAGGIVSVANGCGCGCM
ncbi:chorion class CA protein ERA.1 [Manduca sexta]|uniref:Uncharacterized protein n=1 Tax=Manduca sexta TaxID=7130 RepID=A0A922CEY2_MANSE|nr:chorion class CA protein ERA.1 [Manduca sexta]KAG6444394.1 hypothetical protein O3G_MSEX003335 [Manduca sexta]KAG6444395.1 hypothetical protein O3G_MSEX003335 [Manduca sexta]